jgi:hypothetical protein
VKTRCQSLLFKFNSCRYHLDTWFLAHVAELLVSAAGEGFGGAVQVEYS